ncbi:MAG: gliding motility-associated C-terminal domain-containing protein [Ferruginibacter sp.]
MGQDQISVDSARHANKHIGSVAPGFCGPYHKINSHNPMYIQQQAAMNHAIQNMHRQLPGDTLILPVVVHIINSNPSSVSDLDVLTGIQDLNDAFSKSGNYSASLGADTKIRFCLSKKAPDGGITTGITRTTSFLGDDHNMDTEEDQLKNLIQWDPVRYINIWLVSNLHGEIYADFSCGGWFRLQVGGYATMPPGGGATDGIVVGGFGKVLAHEMGHYLGLYHTFEGGCYNADCLTSGDRVCDTPPDNSVRASFSCTLPENSCFTDTLSSYSNGFFPVNVPDQIANFMDYSNGSCTNQFTQGQADRMRTAVLTLRSGLLQDECTPPCTDNINAGFTQNIPYPLVGDMVDFTNTSTGASGYEWLVDDVSISTGTNYSHSFSATGKYKITLKAFNSPACFSSYTLYVIVNCGVTARFYSNKQTIASTAGIMTDSIIFTNTSYNGLSYQWLVSNNAGMPEQVVSTNTNLTYVFAQAATYSIRLIATNGACSDTSNSYGIPVANPTSDGYPFTIYATCYQQNRVRVRFCLSNDGYASLPAGTPVSFYDADPSLPTANRLLPTYYLPYEVSGSCSDCYTHILNVAYRGLERIYLVFNDAGTSIPVNLPNAGLQELYYFNNSISTYPIRRTVSATICQGDNYAGHTTTGTYVDTLASVLTGCDSVRTLYLTVRPSFQTTLNITICQGDNYAGYTSSGTYVDVFTAANGCDSTRTLHLTVNRTYRTTITTSICQGDNYAGYTSSGTYVDVFTAANGCDSTRTLRLTVLPTVSTTITASICQGDNYAGHTSSGTYVDVYTAANGCDSTRTLHLTVKPVFNTTVTTAICQGDSYGGHSTTGTYTDHFTAVNGCDSTRTLHLTVKPTFRTTVTTDICEGENYAGHSTTGTFVDVYTAANGCDSTRTLHLTVKPKARTTIRPIICRGESFEGYTQPGTYTDVFPGSNGCDSIRTLILTVNPTQFTTVEVARCRGFSYFAGGTLQTTSGIYYDTSRTFQGCDSIIKTILTIHPLPEPELGPYKKICAGDTLWLNPGSFNSYLWNNMAISPILPATEIGIYAVTVTNQFGCKGSDTTAIVEVFRIPANFLPDDSTLCRGNILQIKVPGFVQYEWSTGSRLNMISISRPDKYRLRVRDRNGCYGKDSVTVDFINCVNIQMPNAFTPNGDNLNDDFKPFIPSPVSNYYFQIWNAWGEKVFETRDYKKGWDGIYKSVKQSTGTFVYLVSLKDIDGKEVQKRGSFVLIR